MGQPNGPPPRDDGDWNLTQGRPEFLRLLAGSLALVISLLPFVLLPRGPYFTWPTRNFVVVGGSEVGLVIGGLLFLPFLPMVSYRRRDWLFISFVPIWGLVVAARVGSRLANLPYKDWPLRPGEGTRRFLVLAAEPVNDHTVSAIGRLEGGAVRPGDSMWLSRQSLDRQYICKGVAAAEASPKTAEAGTAGGSSRDAREDSSAADHLGLTFTSTRPGELVAGDVLTAA
jgi:hypothetical protein